MTITLYTAGILVVAAVITLIIFYKTTFKRVKQGQALLVSNAKTCNVYFGSTFVNPFFSTAERINLHVSPVKLQLTAEDTLLTQDSIRVDIDVTFPIYIKTKESHVLKVSQALSASRVSDPALLRKLLSPKFVIATKSAVAAYQFDQLYSDQFLVGQHIVEKLDNNLFGFSLNEVSITRIELTPKENLDPNNPINLHSLQTSIDTQKHANAYLRPELQAESDEHFDAPDEESVDELVNTNAAFVAESNDRFIGEIQKIHADIVFNLEEAAIQNKQFEERIASRMKATWEAPRKERRAPMEEVLPPEPAPVEQTYQPEPEAENHQLPEPLYEEYPTPVTHTVVDDAVFPDLEESWQAIATPAKEDAGGLLPDYFDDIQRIATVEEAEDILENAGEEEIEEEEEEEVSDDLTPNYVDEIQEDEPSDKIFENTAKITVTQTEIKTPSKVSSLPSQALLLHSMLFIAAGPFLALGIFLFRGGFDVPQSSLALVGSVVLTIAGLCGLRFLLWNKGNHKIRTTTTLAVAGFVFWSWPWNRIPLFTAIPLWLVIAVIAGAVVAWAFTRGDRVMQRTSYVALSLSCVLAVIGFASSINLNPKEATIPETLAFAAETPNVYILQLEGFSRLDVLQKQFAFDGWETTDIAEKLKGKGVSVDAQATTNYSEASLSIDAVLNASLPVTSDANLTAQRATSSQTPAVANKTVTWFKENGYDYWHADPGIGSPTVCNDNAQQCYSEESSTSVFDLTPLRVKLGSTQAFGSEGRMTVSGYSTWAKTAAESDKPVLVYARILDPHPPYEASCDPGWKGATQASLNDGWQSQWRADYVKQSSCLLEELEIAMADILEADPSAIIIAQSSYGAAFDIDWTDTLSKWTTDDVWQRFAVFRTLRLPSECQETAKANEASSLVNTLPLLQSCLTGTEPQWVTPQSFLTRYGAETVETIQNLENGVLQAQEASESTESS